jgi:hypothetical protein
MNSRKLLADSLENLLRSESIDKLHVYEIVEHSGLSRATFYRYFYDKFEILNWLYSNILQDNFCCQIFSGASYDTTCYDFLCTVNKKKYVFRNALRSANRLALINHINNVGRKFYDRLLIENNKDLKLNQTVLGVIDLYNKGCCSLLIDWIREEESIPEKDLVRIYKEAMPDILKESYDF